MRRYLLIALSLGVIVGCRSMSSDVPHSPLASISVPEGNRAADSHTPGRPKRPDPAVALYIPGKEGEPRETADVAPPPSLALAGEPKGLPLPPKSPPELPSLPPLPGPEAVPPPPAPPAPTAPSPPPTVGTPVPPPPVPASASESQLRALHTRAMKTYAGMPTYMMRLKRREVVNGTARPEEIMLCKFRQEPYSVYFKWLGPEGKGREVVYVAGQHGNLIHSLTATGDVLFLPGGKRFKVAPDSFLVKSKSRRSITQAGPGAMLASFGKLVDAHEKGEMSQGTAKYLGELKRPEFETKVIGVEQIIPPKSDPLLPRGGHRLWFFDPANGLPVLFVTNDETGREVEYYHHDRFIIPGNLTDEDFDPDRLWKTES